MHILLAHGDTSKRVLILSFATSSEHIQLSLDKRDVFDGLQPLLSVGKLDQ